MREPKNPLLNSSLLLAAVTAFLYCASTAYNGGFLGFLHLDANVLDRDFHQILYKGFLVSFAPAALALLAYAAASYSYSHGVLPGLNDWLRKSCSRKKRYLKLKYCLIEKRKDLPCERRAKKHTFTVFRFVIICIIFISSMLYFEAQGRKEARALNNKVEKPALESDLVFTKIGDKQYKLFKLACGALNCAGVDQTTKLVYYYPSNGYSFQYVPPPQQQPTMNSSKTP